MDRSLGADRDGDGLSATNYSVLEGRGGGGAAGGVEGMACVDKRVKTMVSPTPAVSSRRRAFEKQMDMHYTFGSMGEKSAMRIMLCMKMCCSLDVLFR